VRAQILATEHWSLLGTRSTLWAEVMSRITIHLTVASAALVVLALVAQASGFGSLSRFNDAFRRSLGCSPREYRRQHRM